LSLPLGEIVSPSLHNQRMKPVSSEFQVPFWCFPGSLLERVKHVDPLRELRNIKDSMFGSGVDTNLPNTGSNGGHRLPVVRFKPLLDTPQLEPGDAASVRRKSFEIVPGRSEPKQSLVRHGSIYKYWYMLSSLKLKELGDVQLFWPFDNGSIYAMWTSLGCAGCLTARHGTRHRAAQDLSRLARGQILVLATAFLAAQAPPVEFLMKNDFASPISQASRVRLLGGVLCPRSEAPFKPSSLSLTSCAGSPLRLYGSHRSTVGTCPHHHHCFTIPTAKS